MSDKPKTNRLTQRLPLILAVGALLLIGVGVGLLASWPAALLTVGGLLWADLTLTSIQYGRSKHGDR